MGTWWRRLARRNSRSGSRNVTFYCPFCYCADLRSYHIHQSQKSSLVRRVYVNASSGGCVDNEFTKMSIMTFANANCYVHVHFCIAGKWFRILSVLVHENSNNITQNAYFMSHSRPISIQAVLLNFAKNKLIWGTISKCSTAGSTTTPNDLDTFTFFCMPITQWAPFLMPSWMPKRALTILCRCCGRWTQQRVLNSLRLPFSFLPLGVF